MQRRKRSGSAKVTDSLQLGPLFPAHHEGFYYLDLPFAISDCTSASIGNILFVAGGFKQTTTLLMFDTVHSIWAEVGSVGL